MITHSLISNNDIVHDIHTLPNNKLYMFGYGSLMFASGINGRGMHRTYTNSDLKIATLSNFKRGLSVSLNKADYYGISYSKNDNVVGMVFEITKSDLSILCMDEKSYPAVKNICKATYALADVSKYCSIDGTVLAVINEYAEPKHLHSTRTVWYLSLVWNGIRHHSDTFKHLFLNTGGLIG